MMVMVILAGLTVILVSVCMMGVSMWTFQECYNVLGDFGWYYGDFFMENPRLKDESKSGLSYVGIYRCAQWFMVRACSPSVHVPLTGLLRAL